MPRSLTGRIVLVVVLPILAAWLALGLTLTVILGNLHADAARSSLGDIGQTLVARFRNAVLDRDLRTLVGEVKDAVADTDISVQVLRADGTYVDLGTAGGPATPTGSISIPASAPRGATITGSAPFTDGQSHLFAATVLRQVGAAGPRAVVLSVPDRSRAAAIADLVRTLPVVVLVSTIVGLPLVLLLSRSVGAPLRRLADATADLPVRSGHDPLPLEGPSEVRELTARFNAMAGELTDARQREAELLADLRHDLRTPLTVIGGYATALADGTAVGPDAERAARTIGEEAARLGRLVDELGAVERLRQGVDGIRPEALDAGDVMRATAARFESVAAAAGIELSVVAGERAPAAEPTTAPGTDALAFVADRGAVERIMANLVNNALASAPSGGHVWLSAAPGPAAVQGAAGSVVLAVTDDGPGFPPGAGSHVFERFYRADPARTGPGTGLGLTIVRELAAAHGGTAHAENVAPRGARVSVVLPKVPPAR
ncbi:MAG: HAMP domain-containing sensor histidine kinase [Candidatus Limnocylindrales bacterium]